MNAILKQLTCGLALLWLGAAAPPASASDHLDTPAVQQDGRLDIGDLYAWMSSDGEHLNLMLTIVGKRFAPDAEYVFHMDQGAAFGRTTLRTDIRCRIGQQHAIDCRMGTLDRAEGPSAEAGAVESRHRHFRVYAGLRLDPFFNNVRGTRAAYNVSIAALQGGAERDASACPRFDRDTSQRLLAAWQQTEGGPAQDFLQDWETAVLAVQLKLAPWRTDGDLVAVWASTHRGGQQVDRAGRPLIAVSLLGTLGPAATAGEWRDAYNRATPEEGDRFVAALENGLAEYDAFDGHCGNAWLAASDAPAAQRYAAAARLLADDRLWVNTRHRRCAHFLAVERFSLGGESELAADCGGRTPNQDANNVLRSLLVGGTPSGVSDGVARKQPAASDEEFPFARPKPPPALPDPRQGGAD